MNLMILKVVLMESSPIGTMTNKIELNEIDQNEINNNDNEPNKVKHN